MCKELFDKIFGKYSEEGRLLIWFGSGIIILWVFVYFFLALLKLETRIHPTLPLLVFGALCVFVGMLRKKKRMKRKYVIGGIEELGLVILGLEFVAAFLVMLVFLPKVFITMKGVTFIISLVLAIILSGLTIATYYYQHADEYFFLNKYDKWLLFVSILSHLVWASLIKTIV